jgi:hypothetical protein
VVAVIVRRQWCGGGGSAKCSGDVGSSMAAARQRRQHQRATTRHLRQHGSGAQRDGGSAVIAAWKLQWWRQRDITYDVESDGVGVADVYLTKRMCLLLFIVL